MHEDWVQKWIFENHKRSQTCFITKVGFLCKSLFKNESSCIDELNDSFFSKATIAIKVFKLSIKTIVREAHLTCRFWTKTAKHYCFFKCRYLSIKILLLYNFDSSCYYWHISKSIAWCVKPIQRFLIIIKEKLCRSCQNIEYNLKFLVIG